MNRRLRGYIRQDWNAPPQIRRAILYSLTAGGKRLRPALCILTARLFGAPLGRALPAACALEMIHTYSLIHDDLPCMDDDDFRRGRKTCHRKFGEAVAVLAGDGLLTKAFELLGTIPPSPRRGGSTLIRTIARGAGIAGMVGGQVEDLAAEGFSPRRRGAARLLRRIHEKKTAALLSASVEAGAILGGASRAQRRALAAYGRDLGLAFQIADDVLDVIGDKKKLGKSGSDRANKKLTYARLYGVSAALAQARALARRAKNRLAALARTSRRLHPGSLQALSALADFVVSRDR